MEEAEPLPGPSGEGPGAGHGRGAGRWRGVGRGRGAGHTIEDSSEEENGDTSFLHLDYLGADTEEQSSDSSEEEEEDGDESEEDEEQVQEKEEGDESEEEEEKEEKEEEEVEDNPPAARQKKRGLEEHQFGVGDFVTAVYEGQWLLAQVDIDQEKSWHVSCQSHLHGKGW